MIRGPSLFKGKFGYDKLEFNQHNVVFKSKRLFHSFDKHVKKCFNRMANQNKATLQEFQGKIENVIQSPDAIKYNGSYRYETLAYIYKHISTNIYLQRKRK